MVVELGREPFELHLFQKSFIQGGQIQCCYNHGDSNDDEGDQKKKSNTHRRFNEVRLAKVSAFMHSILFALINSSWKEALVSR